MFLEKIITIIEWEINQIVITGSVTKKIRSRINKIIQEVKKKLHNKNRNHKKQNKSKDKKRQIKIRMIIKYNAKIDNRTKVVGWMMRMKITKRKKKMK